MNTKGSFRQVGKEKVFSLAEESGLHVTVGRNCFALAGALGNLSLRFLRKPGVTLTLSNDVTAQLSDSPMPHFCSIS